MVVDTKQAHNMDNGVIWPRSIMPLLGMSVTVAPIIIVMIKSLAMTSGALIITES